MCSSFIGWGENVQDDCPVAGGTGCAAGVVANFLDAGLTAFELFGQLDVGHPILLAQFADQVYLMVGEVGIMMGFPDALAVLIQGNVNLAACRWYNLVRFLNCEIAAHELLRLFNAASIQLS